MTEFYTDEGVLPRSAELGSLANTWIISPLNANGQPVVVFIFMVAALLTYGCFMVGYRAKLATFLSWFFISSFSARNTAIAHGGDDILRLCLFWAMFLKLDTFWSVQQEPDSPNTFPARLAFITQLFLMYFWTGLLKWHPRWHSEGSAVYYALQLDTFSKPIGRWLLTQPFQVLRGVTFATLWLELLGPVAWLLSGAWPRLRMSITFLFIAFHFGLMMSLELGPFPFTCAVYWIALLPADFWELLRRWQRIPNILLSKIPAVEPPTIRINESATASMSTSTSMPGLAQANWAISASAPAQRPLKFWRETFIVSCYLIAFYWNIAVYSDKDSLVVDPITTKIGFLLRLHQRWDMFAPFPRTADGWLVVDAILNNYEHYDILNDRPVNFEKPPNLADDMVDTLWRKYFTNLTNYRFKSHLPYFSRWLCKEWNENQKPSLKAVKITVWLVSENTPPPGKPVIPTPPMSLWEQYCLP